MLWTTLLLGLVEGLTEFLPVSSTGHLILASSLVGFEGPRAAVFEISIQLGAILAVVWEYRVRLPRLLLEAPRAEPGRSFPVRLLLAFLPAAILGLLLDEVLLERLFEPRTVAGALVAGGVLILVVEALPLRTRTREVARLSWSQALGVGLAQCLALWPGFSRSAATILGGLVVGLDRRTATEFSFLLAVPTVGAAAGYKLLAAHAWLERGDLAWLGLGLAVSFGAAWATIRWLLHYVATHGFRVFAWYRIALGCVVLLVLRGQS